MRAAMFVRTFMMKPAITLDPELGCREALQLFHAQRIRRAPVVAGTRLIGIISERDLLRVLPASVLELDSDAGYLAARRHVRSAMTPDPLTVGPDTHLEDAARIMARRRIGGLPVVERGLVIGMLTESDLFRALIQIIGGEEGIRITAMPPEPGAGGGFNDNIATLCMRLSLRMDTLLTHSGPGGGRLVMICATGQRTKELPKALSDAGYTLIEASEAGHARGLPSESSSADSASGT